MQHVDRHRARLAFALGLLVLIAVVAPQLLPACWVMHDGFMVVWAMALAAIAWLGLHRPRVRWQRARVRTIVGSAPPPERELSASSAMLSREVGPVTTRELVEALRLCRLGVEVRFGRLDIAIDEEPIARLRTRRRGRWLPAEMTIDLCEHGDASVIVAVLVELFGAIEYTSPRGSVVVIE
jgi:hypothetical protein